jgi:hypothetical protein
VLGAGAAASAAARQREHRRQDHHAGLYDSEASGASESPAAVRCEFDLRRSERDAPGELATTATPAWR